MSLTNSLLLVMIPVHVELKWNVQKLTGIDLGFWQLSGLFSKYLTILGKIVHDLLPKHSRHPSSTCGHLRPPCRCWSSLSTCLSHCFCSLQCLPCGHHKGCFRSCGEHSQECYSIRGAPRKKSTIWILDAFTLMMHFNVHICRKP